MQRHFNPDTPECAHPEAQGLHHVLHQVMGQRPRLRRGAQHVQARWSALRNSRAALLAALLAACHRATYRAATGLAGWASCSTEPQPSPICTTALALAHRRLLVDLLQQRPALKVACGGCAQMAPGLGGPNASAQPDARQARLQVQAGSGVLRLQRRVRPQRRVRAPIYTGSMLFCPSFSRRKMTWP